jgi:hypothetical protein
VRGNGPEHSARQVAGSSSHQLYERSASGFKDTTLDDTLTACKAYGPRMRRPNMRAVELLRRGGCVR